MIYEFLVGGFENMWATLQTLVYIHKLLVATFDDTCEAFYLYNKRNIHRQLRTGLPIYLPSHSYFFLYIE